MNALHLAPGMVVADRFSLISVLGTGGMAVVFEAHDQVIERRVALKVLYKTEATARFQREAKAASALHHPAVVKVFGIGTLPEGNPYIALEFIEGETLIDGLNRVGPMAPERALTLLMPVVGALAEAHAIGIVHRDIKPSNLILQRAAGQYESLRLLDFGIALMDEGKGQRLTQTGEIFGTPEFMAPEQAVGKPVGPAADVWALGAVLYELLTGEPPFSGTHAPGILYKVVNEPMPPLPDSIPPEMADLIGECLAKDPVHRPATASVLLSKMEALLLREAPALISSLSPLPVQPPRVLIPALTHQQPSSNQRRPLRLFAIACLVAVGAFGIWWAAFRPSASPQPRLTASTQQAERGADQLIQPANGRFATSRPLDSADGAGPASAASAPFQAVPSQAPPSQAVPPEAPPSQAPASLASASQAPASLASASQAPASQAPASQAPRSVGTPRAKVRPLARAQTYIIAGRYREALAWLKSHPDAGNPIKRARIQAHARSGLADLQKAQRAAAAATEAPKVDPKAQGAAAPPTEAPTFDRRAQEAHRLIRQLSKGGDCPTRKRLITALGKLEQEAAIRPIAKEREAVGFSNLCMKDTIDDALKAIRAAQP